MGKGTETPPVPDYTGAAEKTAAGNLENARAATTANRPNQYTPYGTSEWTQGAPVRTFNQQRYDAALKASQQGNTAGRMVGGNPEIRDEQGNLLSPAYNGTWQEGNSGAAPDKNAEQFYDMNPSDNWTQNVKLAPLAQQTLDKQMGLSNQYADLATEGLEKARGVLSDPTLDMSQIPERAMHQGQTAQDAIMARLGPQYQQQEEALRARLANQGVAAGSEAYDKDFRQFNQGRNDAQMQAALYGIGLDNQNRSSALQEQAYIQDRPLNLVNALRTGAQVQNPTFSNPAQQQAVSGPDYSGATNAEFQGNLSNANATNASNAQETQGIMSAAAMAAMMMF